jgi:hypothetical protein
MIAVVLPFDPTFHFDDIVADGDTIGHPSPFIATQQGTWGCNQMCRFGRGRMSVLAKRLSGRALGEIGVRVVT